MSVTIKKIENEHDPIYVDLEESREITLHQGYDAIFLDKKAIQELGLVLTNLDLDE